MHQIIGRKQREIRKERRSLVAKMGVMVYLQVLGHIPFLARCSNPNCSLGEGVKLAEVLCVCAQHAGTQIPTPLRSGAVQAVGKRHARQYVHQGLTLCAASRLNQTGD